MKTGWLRNANKLSHFEPIIFGSRAEVKLFLYPLHAPSLHLLVRDLKIGIYFWPVPWSTNC
jgi:hypothetical protein